jgi:hypothetical protein
VEQAVLEEEETEEVPVLTGHQTPGVVQVELLYHQAEDKEVQVSL